MHVTIVPKFLIVIKLMTTKTLWVTYVTTMMIRIVMVFLTWLTTVSVIPMLISWILTVTEWETNVIRMPIMINFSMNKTIVCWFSIRINRQVLLDVKKATLLSKLNIFSSNYLPIFYDLRMRMETDVVIFVRMILMLMVLTTTSILVQTILEFMPRISELTKLLYLILMEIHKSIQIGSFITKVWLPY